MPALTNTVQTFQQVGIREQLSDIIFNISPTDTPFTSGARKGKCESRNPEWLKDSLRNPNPANAQVEGNDSPTAVAAGQPARLKNYVQLFDETVIVSDTARAVKTAGRQDELKYQVAKSAKSLKRDMEMRFLGNYASVVGNSTTAGQSAGVEAWLTTNVNRGATGANGGYSSGTGLVSAATDGTARAFAKTQVDAVIANAWNAGGEPDTLMCSGTKKQAFTAFTGIATNFNQVNRNTDIITYSAVDIYKSDFGFHRVVPNRFIGASGTRTPTNGLYPGQSVLVLDFKTWEIMFLQPFTTIPLARTGHAEKRLLKAEATLANKEEAANAIVADLT